MSENEIRADLLRALKTVDYVLQQSRFAGTDNNPYGIRDIVFSAIKKGEPEYQGYGTQTSKPPVGSLL